MSIETPPYFPYPFAIDGDVTAVPNTTQPSGSVSYQQGYGPDYEKNLLTDPTALPIGRTTFNQVLFDVTTLLQQYSQYGVPLFVTASQNLGVPLPYPIFARTYYSGQTYENQVAGNIVTPGVDDSWLVISGDSTGVLVGTVLDYAGFTAPAGYLTCDGSAVSRATYGPLLATITQTQTGTTTNTLDTVSGLTSTAQMYVGMPLESANFVPGTTVASIVDANNITTSTTATASGSVSIQFFNWLNGDGSTTFNLPLLQRKVTVGQGGSPSSTPFGLAGTVVGEFGGQEAHTMTEAELFAHNHNFSLLGNGSFSAGNQFFTIPNGTNPVDFTDDAGNKLNPSDNLGALWPTGSSTPFNVMQPSVVMYKIIKT